jgi:hypothetical protein
VKQYRLLFAILIVLPALACRAATRLISGDEPIPSDGTPTVPAATATASQPTDEVSCPSETSSIIQAANSQSLPSAKFPSVDTGNSIDIPLVTYTINGDQIEQTVLEQVPDSLLPYQSDFSIQESAWKLFTALIPKDQRALVGQYQVMTDGPGGVLSAVEQTSQDPRSWVLEIDIADVPDTKSLAFTLLHEFGHLLTLGPSQVPPDLQIFNDPHSRRTRERALAACNSYFPGDGCSLPESYLNVFFSRFWRDLYDEWKAIDGVRDDIHRDVELHTFYRKYHDRFVDSYAVTNPSEDIAESWAFYILNPQPEGDSVMEQKLKFFHEYPELVKLRSRILTSLCAANP